MTDFPFLLSHIFLLCLRNEYTYIILMTLIIPTINVLPVTTKNTKINLGRPNPNTAVRLCKVEFVIVEYSFRFYVFLSE